MTFSVLRIDGALVADHSYLTAEDECYYLGDYLPRVGYQAGPVNDLISNLKKPVSRRHLPEYRHKERAIARSAELLSNLLNPAAQAHFTFVPIPPSKARDHPMYDDRLVRILRAVRPALDVREAVICSKSSRSHHEFEEGERRPTPEELVANLKFDTSVVEHMPLKADVFLFDDVLTNGTHYRASKRVLLRHRHDLRVVGLFIGRTKRPPPAAFDLEDF